MSVLKALDIPDDDTYGIRYKTFYLTGEPPQSQANLPEPQPAPKAERTSPFHMVDGSDEYGLPEPTTKAAPSGRTSPWHMGEEEPFVINETAKADRGRLNPWFMLEEEP